eukprot:3941395-Rhodomonas_salina.2
MGRPKASKRNKQIALFFASIVTVPVPSQGPESTLSAETVGRQGPHSLFEIFSQVCPSATRERTRDGLTLSEFNKILKKDGWPRVKFRASARQIADGHVGGSTFYQFGGRRWRNPDDSADMAALTQVSDASLCRARCAVRH